jgi:nucleoid DNA-binding protein
MKRIHLLLICLLAAAACRNNKDSQIKALEKSLENSNNFISSETERLYHMLEDKNNDPYTHERALTWLPMAMAVQKLSGNIKAYVDSLKTVNLKGGQKELFGRISGYRQAVLHAFLHDSVSNFLYYDKEKVKIDLAYIAKGLPIDSAYDSEAVSSGGLSKIKNDILLTENRLVNYVYTHVNVQRDDFYNSWSAIVAPNRMYLKKGQTLSIFAGMGAFSTRAKPNIMINGVECPINAEGLAEYKFPATGTPGKHFIPVRIAFTSMTGSHELFTKTIEYEIAP